MFLSVPVVIKRDVYAQAQQNKNFKNAKPNMRRVHRIWLDEAVDRASKIFLQTFLRRTKIKLQLRESKYTYAFTK